MTLSLLSSCLMVIATLAGHELNHTELIFSVKHDATHMAGSYLSYGVNIGLVNP